MSRLFDARAYRTLLAVGLRLSLTGARGAGTGAAAGADGSRHLIGAAYGLTLTALTAGLLFGNTTPAGFLLVTMTIAMVFTATAVIGELAGGLFHPLDLAVTGHLPVPAFTRLAARFTELLVTLSILTLTLNIAPAALFAFLPGPNSLAGAAAAAAPAVCLAAAFCAALFTAGACLLVYALLARFLTAARFEGLLLYLNILVSLGVLALLLNLGRVIEIGALAGAEQGRGLLCFPPWWFSGLALWVLGLPGGTAGAAAAAGAGLCAALLPLLLAAAGAEGIVGALSNGGRAAGRGRSAPGGAMRLFERLFVRPAEKAAFEFTAVNLGRDRGFRLKTYPILGVPILMLLMSLPDRRDPLFFILMLHLMNLYLPLVLSFLPFGEHHRAAWIFEALPAAKPRIFLQGAEKAFIFRVALPLFLLNAAALAVIWTPGPGVLNAFYAFLAGLFPVGAALGRMKEYPFSRPFRGAVTQNFGGALSGAVVFLGPAAWIQYASRDSLPVLLAGIALMLLCHKARFALRARRAAAAGPAGPAGPTERDGPRPCSPPPPGKAKEDSPAAGTGDR